jgi:hypothetical protein
MNGGATPTITAAGRLAFGANENRCIAGTEPPDATYDLFWKVRVNEVGSFSESGVLCCWHTGNGDWYRAALTNYSGNSGYIHRVAGLSIQGGGASGAVTISAGNTYECKLEVRASTLTLFYRVSGSGTWIQVCQLTDSVLPRNTSGSSKAGIWNLAASSDSTGLQIDDWEIVSVGEVTPDTTAPAFASAAVPSAGTTVVVTLTEGESAPILPETGITGFSLTVAGEPRTISSAARTTSNTLTLTVASVIYSGEAVLLSYTPGNVTDSATSPNSMSSFSAQSVTNNSTEENPETPLAAGTLTCTSRYPAIAMEATAPTGGVEPYTQQWYVSTDPLFTPGVGTLLSGETGLTCEYTPPDHEPRWFKVVYTDDEDTTVTSDVRGATLHNAPLIWGVVGDSTSAATGEAGSVGGPYWAALRLGELTQRTVTLVNRAIGGSNSAQWLPDNTYLNNAIAAFQAAGVTDVSIRLGTNNTSDSVSAELVAEGTAEHVLAIAEELLAEGVERVHIDWPFSQNPNGTLTRRNNIADLLLMGAALDGICNGTTILQGDRTSYRCTIDNPASMYDGVHATPTFEHTVGSNIARALYDSLYAETESTDYPSVDDVRAGTSFNGLTGTLVLPDADQVEEGVAYGADGTEYTGTFAGGTTVNALSITLDENGGDPLLTWEAADDATSYNVLRATDPQGPYTVIASELTDLTYTDTGAPGAAYYTVVGVS